MCSTCGCKGAESFCSECGTKRAESFEAEGDTTYIVQTMKGNQVISKSKEFKNSNEAMQAWKEKNSKKSSDERVVVMEYRDYGDNLFGDSVYADEKGIYREESFDAEKDYDTDPQDDFEMAFGTFWKDITDERAKGECLSCKEKIENSYKGFLTSEKGNIFCIDCLERQIEGMDMDIIIEENDAESFEAPKGQLFTPYKNTTSDETINMRINATDMRNFDKLPNKSRRTVLITNMKDGKRYYVRRADCGAGCYCAAEVVKVKEAESFEAEYDERSPALRNFGTIALLALAVFVGKKLKE